MNLVLQSLYIWIIFFTGAAFLAFGVYAFYKDKENSNTTKIFLYLSLAFSFWSFSWLYVLLQKDHDNALFGAKLLNSGAALIPALYLSWAYSILRMGMRRKLILASVFLLSLLFVFLSFSNWHVSGLHEIAAFDFWPTPGTTYKWFILFYFLIIAIAFYELSRKRKKADTVTKKKIAYLFYGSALGFGGGTFNFAAMYSLPFINLYFLLFGALLMLIAPIPYVYAAANYRLMNTKFYIRKAVVTAASLSVTIFLCLSARETVNRFIDESILPDLFILAAAPIIYIHLVQFFYAVANKYLFASLYNANLLVKEIGDKLWRARSYKEIGESLYRSFENIFHADKFAIVGVDAKTGTFDIIYNNGFNLDNEKLFVEANLKNLFANHKNEPIVADEFVTRNFLSLKLEAAVDWFQTVKPAILAPFSEDGKVSGFVLIGPKKSEDVFSREDIQVIKEAARSVSLAIGIVKRDEERERELREMREFVNSLGTK